MSTDPGVAAAAWANFDQHIAAGNANLDEFVDHAADSLDGLTPEQLIAVTITMLEPCGHDTLVSLAALSTVRLAQIRRRDRNGHRT